MQNIVEHMDAEEDKEHAQPADGREQTADRGSQG